MDLSKCTEKIVKIAENNVEVQKVLYGKDGKEVVVQTDTYGRQRIDAEKIVVATEKARLATLDTSKAISEQDDELAKLNLIQVEMEKENDTKV